MKIKTLVAGTTMAIAGFVGASAHPASAGCGVSIEAHNRDAVDSTVDWEDSDVRIRERIFGQWVNGPWKKLGNYSTNVEAGDTVVQAFTMDFGCSFERQYRLEVSQGGSTWFETTGFSTDSSPHIHVD